MSSGLKYLLNKKSSKIFFGSVLATSTFYVYESYNDRSSITTTNDTSTTTTRSSTADPLDRGILGNILFNIRMKKVLCESKPQPDLLNPDPVVDQERLPLWKQENYYTGGEPSTSSSSSSTQIIEQERIDRASREVVSWMSQQLIPGVSICVMVKGDTIWKDGFGYADVENSIKVTPHTKMRVASISKALTSAAVGLLIEDGKLDIDEKVQKYVPEFPINPSHPETAPTVRQIASHIGGIRHYTKGPTSEFYSVQQFISDAIKDNPNQLPSPLSIFISNPWIDAEKSAPGQTYNYSTFGYTLLGTIIERVSKNDFITFMKQRVFLRCAMFDTFADQHNVIISNRSRQYAMTSGKNTNNKYSSSGESVNPQLVNAEFANSSYKYAGGGILSTAQDICRFGTYMISGQLLKRSTLDIIFHAQKTNNGKSSDYAIGWLVKPNHQISNRNLNNTNNGNQDTSKTTTTITPSPSTLRVTDTLDNKIIYHTGGAVGGSSILVVVPKYGIVLCVLANLEGVKGIVDLGCRVANIFVPDENQSSN